MVVGAERTCYIDIESKMPMAARNEGSGGEGLLQENGGSCVIDARELQVVVRGARIRCRPLVTFGSLGGSEGCSSCSCVCRAYGPHEDCKDHPGDPGA